MVDVGQIPNLILPMSSLSNKYFLALCTNPQQAGHVILKVVDLRTGKSVREIDGHNCQVWGSAFSADGRWLATLDELGFARLWALPQE
jgi:WD40 repeat protein